MPRPRRNLEYPIFGSPRSLQFLSDEKYSRKNDELEKNEAIDKKLLRYLTVRVKKFDLEANYFAKREDDVKKENYKN